MMSNESKKIPLRRNFISLELKIQILDRLKKGEKVSNVAKSLNLNEATIRTIKKNENKIRTAVSAGSSIFANMTARPRAPIIEKMEKVLSIWIEESTRQQIPLDGNMIKQKALKIYNYLKKNGESSVEPEFVASKGWFERFKKRFVLRSIRIQGESTTVDNEVVKNYPEELQKFITDHGFLPHQVFNVDETDLWWKHLSNNTAISEKEKTEESLNVKMDAEESNDAASADLSNQELLVEKEEEDKANFMEITMKVNQTDSSEEDNSADENMEGSNLTLTSIRKGINLAEELESYFLNVDPSIERSTKFKRDLRQCLAPYYELYKNLSTKKEQILSTVVKKEKNI